MSYRIDIRQWRRPDQPQPVYKGALNLFEPYLYAAIGNATRNSYRMADAVRDKTYILQTVPEFGWIFTGTPAVFDVRLSQVVVDQLATDTTANSVRLSQLVVDYLFDQATQAQIWPAIEENLGRNYRTPERARFSVRYHDTQPENGWLFKVTAPIVASWAGIWAGETQTFRTRERAKLDVRLYEWSPSVSSWISQIPAPPPFTFTTPSRNRILYVGPRENGLVIPPRRNVFYIPPRPKLIHDF